LKKLSALMLGFASVFFLSGCSAQDRSGTFYETFVKPMDMFLSKIHEYVGSWGWSIVIITLIVRIIILPFMLNNYKTQNKARRGQVLARPELEVVIMKKYDANPISVGGCLPLLIQMPFLTGLFFTLTNPLYSAGIIDSTYLGIFSLGTRSYVLPIIAFLVYAAQTKLTMAINPPLVQPGQEAMQGQMQMMQWLSPVMIAVFSFWVAGAVAVYYIVGGLFLIFQTYLGYKIYPPYKPEKEKKQEFDPNKVTLVSNKKKRK